MKIKNEKIKSYKIFIFKEVLKRLFIFYITILIIVFVIWRLLGYIYKPVKVPQITNLPVEQAINLLRSRSLRYEIDYRSSPSILKNYVMYQYPDPDVIVKEGRNITVVLSSGSVTVEIPDLRNLNLFEARKQIMILNENYNDIGIRLGNTAYVYDANIPFDHVIAQTPLPNTHVSDNVSIALLLSSGPAKEKMIMPYCVEQNINDIRPVFENLGISYNIYEKVEKDLEEGTIVRQQPEALNFLDSTSSVMLVISRKTPESHYNVQRLILIDYLIPDKLVPVDLKIVIVDNQGRHEIYNKKTMSGTKLELSYLVTGNAMMEVYINGKFETRERII